jgi:hypothetical protein
MIGTSGPGGWCLPSDESAWPWQCNGFRKGELAAALKTWKLGIERNPTAGMPTLEETLMYQQEI